MSLCGERCSTTTGLRLAWVNKAVEGSPEADDELDDDGYRGVSDYYESVEVKRETARVERERIGEPAPGAELREEEIEVPLHAEEAVVQKQTVAKERVGIEKDVEQRTETVSDEVRRSASRSMTTRPESESVRTAARKSVRPSRAVTA